MDHCFGLDRPGCVHRQPPNVPRSPGTSPLPSESSQGDQPCPTPRRHAERQSAASLTTNRPAEGCAAEGCDWKRRSPLAVTSVPERGLPARSGTFRRRGSKVRSRVGDSTPIQCGSRQARQAGNAFRECRRPPFSNAPGAGCFPSFTQTNPAAESASAFSISPDPAGVAEWPARCLPESVRSPPG